MRFTLAIDTAGRAVLATAEKLTDAQIVALRAAFAAWQAGDPPEALIVGDCEVLRVTDVTLDLEPAGAR